MDYLIQWNATVEFSVSTEYYPNGENITRNDSIQPRIHWDDLTDVYIFAGVL